MLNENRKLGDLPSISAAEIDETDLIFVSDISAVTSKKMQFSELQSFVLSGSNGTVASASNALYARSSSVALSANTSTLANFASTATFAVATISSSYATSASWAPTVVVGASSLGTGSTYPFTSSWSITSSNALVSAQSLFLTYNNTNNGTAFNAISASVSKTASFINAGGLIEATASWAKTASLARSSSYLIYDGIIPNGTASYAITADLATTSRTATRLSSGTLRGYMIFGLYTGSLGVNQNDTFSYIYNTMSISNDDTGQTGNTAQCIINCWGNVKTQWTQSVDAYPYVYLGIRNMATNATFELDRSIITMMANSSGALWSGSIDVGFNLCGISSSLSGSYMVYVGTSESASLHPSRSVRFKVEAAARNFSIDI